MPCLAQSPVILDLDLENETNYLYDVFDYSKIGSDPAAPFPNGGFRNFAISVAVDDVVAVNGKPAKGVFLFKGFGARLRSEPDSRDSSRRTSTGSRRTTSTSKSSSRTGRR